MHPTLLQEPEETTNLLHDNELYKRQPFRIYLIAALSAIGGFLFGYDTGIIAGAMLFIKDQFSLNDVWQEAVVSSTLLTAWLFSILSGKATDVFGRKPVILTSSVIFLVGSLVLAFADNKMELVLGRLVVGAGVGIASMTAPMYIAELAPPSIRGKLLLIYMSCITGGQFVASIVAWGFGFVSASYGWRLMLGAAGLPAAIQLFAFAALPESPRWLVSKRRFDEALSVLRLVRRKDANIEAEFAAICDSNTKAKHEHHQLLASLEASYRSNATNNNNNIEDRHQVREVGIFKRILNNQAVLKALLIGCMLQLIQQLSAINTFMYYSTYIIKMSGVNSNSTVLLLSAGTAFVNFVGTGAGYLFVERAGRRKLVLISLAGVAISLAVVGVGFQLYEHESNTNSNVKLIDANLQEDVPHKSRYSFIVIIAMVAYLSFFSPGMGPMPWTINSEIYPSWARSWCLSAATSVCWLANLLVSMSFLSLGKAITKYGAFYLYSGCAAFGFIFFALYLPETKGKTLEELENLFAPKPRRKKKSIDSVEDTNAQSNPNYSTIARVTITHDNF